MATSTEIRRGGSNKAQGIDSDILLGSTITALNLAAELAKHDVEPGTMAYNRIYVFDPTNAGAICAMLDPDGKWYTPAGAEVT